MGKKLGALFALVAAISSPAIASDPIVLFRVERSGHVFMDCVGVDYIGMASVKARLEELKRWNPRMPIDFRVEAGAPADLVSKYRKLIVSERFIFGKANGPCN